MRKLWNNIKVRWLLWRMARSAAAMELKRKWQRENGVSDSAAWKHVAAASIDRRSCR